MPIRGLTTNARATQVRIGKLRKGEPKTSVTCPGKDIEGAFRFTAEDDDKDIQAAFETAYGHRPEHVDAFLATPDIDEAWECWKEEWTASSLKHRCDGIKCVTWQDADLEYHHVNWDEARQCYTNDLGQVVPLEQIPDCPGGCKEVGRLQLLLPEMIAAGYVGPVTLETHSKHDILSITGGLNDLQAKSNGNLAGILLRVYRVTQEITASYADKKTGEIKRRKTPKSLVKIRPSVEWVQAQIEGAQRHALLALAGPEPEAVETTALIEGEYTIEDEPITEPEADPNDPDLFAEPEADALPAAWLINNGEDVIRGKLLGFLGSHGIESIPEAAEKLGLPKFADFGGNMMDLKRCIEELSKVEAVLL